MRSAVIVPVHHEGDSALRLLQELLVQLSPEDGLYVVLTGTDTYSALHALAGVRPVVRLCPAPGAFPGEARNIGIAAAQDAEFIVQMDAGCYISPGWLDKMLAPLLRGTFDYIVGAIQPHRSATRFWGIALDREAFFVALTQQRGRRPGDLVGGAAVAYRRVLWERSGGFPGDMRCGSDKVFARRVAALAPRTLFVDEAVAYWELGPNASDMLRREYRYFLHDALLPRLPLPAWVRLGEGAALALTAGLALCLHPAFLLLLVPALAYLLLNTGRKIRRYRMLARSALRQFALPGYAYFFFLNLAVRACRSWGVAYGLILRTFRKARKARG